MDLQDFVEEYLPVSLKFGIFHLKKHTQIQITQMTA